MFSSKNALSVFNSIDCLVNDLIIVWLFYLKRQLMCGVTTILVFIKTSTYLEVLWVIISPDIIATFGWKLEPIF